MTTEQPTGTNTLDAPSHSKAHRTMAWDDSAPDQSMAILSSGRTAFAYGPHVDVTHPEFGAIGDGTTDDGTAIQNTINSLGTIGGVVFCPPGLYSIGTTLELDTSIILQGPNWNASSIRINFPNIYGVVALSKTYTGIQDIRIEAGTACSGGVFFDSSHHNELRSVLVRGDTNADQTAVMTDGIRLGTSYWNKIDNCEMWYQTGKNLYLAGAHDTTVIGGYYGYADYNIYLDTSRNISLTQPSTEQAASAGIYAAGDLRGATIVNPRIEGGASTGTGIGLNAARTLTVVGGQIGEYETAPIHFANNTKNCVFKGMYIDNSTGTIVFESTTRQNRLEDCLLASVTNITYAGLHNEFINCRHADLESTRRVDSFVKNTSFQAGTGTLALDRFHDTVVVGNLSDNLTITLPNANTVPRGKQYTIKLGTVGSYTVTIARTASQTIDGADANLILNTDYESVTLQQYNDDRWIIVADHDYCHSTNVAWNPGAIDPGAFEAKEVLVSEATLGDFATASFSLDVADLVLNAQVTAAGTVTCVLANNTAGTVDLGNGVVYIRVFPK